MPPPPRAAVAPAPEWAVAYKPADGEGRTQQQQQHVGGRRGCDDVRLGPSLSALPSFPLVLPSAPIVLGESPVWNCASQRLYLIDIDGCALHRLDPATGRHQRLAMPDAVGAVGLVAEADVQPSAADVQPSSADAATATATDSASSAERCWFATASGVRLLDWRSLRSAPLAPHPGRPDTRPNDGKVSPGGDLFLGSMVSESDAKKRSGRGHLFRLSAPADCGAANRLHSEVALSGATISNGMDFADAQPAHAAQSASCVSADPACAASPAASSSPRSAAAPPAQLLYWTDTPLQRVECFDVSAAGGGPAPLANRRVSFRCSGWTDPADGLAITGAPDGLALDSAGGLWVAMNGGGCVVRVDPASGRPLRCVRFPVSKVTALCFGGPGLRSLFVTSASKGADRIREPLAGAVFCVPDIGVAGRPSNRLRGKFDVDAAPGPGLIQQHRAEEDRFRTHATAAAPSASSAAICSKL